MAVDAKGLRRPQFVLLGSLVLSAVILFAWFPASSLLRQRSGLADAQSQLSTLHAQDAALGQEQKSLSDVGEIGRIAREQYQLVSPGQQAYEVLPPSGAAAVGHGLFGRSRAAGSGDPVGRPRAPAGGRHHRHDRRGPAPQ